MKRYILPTIDWAALVPIIVRDAPPGAVLEVHTEAMAELVGRALEAAGRADLLSWLQLTSSGISAHHSPD